MKILLIIPAYNEEKSILRVCKTVEKYGNGVDYIVINDGSKDDTLKILQENHIPHINLKRNLGIGGAVQTGYRYAYKKGYDIAVQFDGDGQHDIKYVKNICKPIINGNANLCIGSRFLDKETSEFKSTFTRRIGIKYISLLIKLFTKRKITDPTSGFRAADRTVIKMFANKYPAKYPEPEANLEVLLRGYKVKEVPVNMYKRESGKSFVNIYTSIEYMVKVGNAIIRKGICFKK